MHGRDGLFDWDAANIGHLRRHKVKPVEAEQVLLNAPLDLGMEFENGEERFLSLGETLQGRVLIVVSTWREDRIRVVTGFEPDKRLAHFYHAERSQGR